jgi:hypothetical protein
LLGRAAAAPRRAATATLVRGNMVNGASKRMNQESDCQN